MAYRFRSYELLPEKVQVEGSVLFGDKEDTDISNVGVKPEKSQGGTICFELRPHTLALPGLWLHGMVHTYNEGRGSDEESRGGDVHVIHHDSVDGTKLGKYLCRTDSMADWKLKNVWNRYDWCHGRNWGGSGPGINFVSVSDSGKELGRIEMTEESVIQGDWNYGLRVTNKEDGIAFAYVYQDCLTYDALACEIEKNPRKDENGQEYDDPDYEVDKECTFEENIEQFLRPEKLQEILIESWKDKEF